MQRKEQIQLLRALGILEPEPVEEAQVETLSEPEVNFDGGARESAPLPSDPVNEHNLLALEVIQRASRGGI